MRTIKQRLKEIADVCFTEGYSRTVFMRQISATLHVEFGIRVDAEDGCDFYTPSKNPYMLRIIKWLGYDNSPFGFCKIKND